MTTAGKEHVVYSFRNQDDGDFPEGALLDVKGKLDGMASVGGKSGAGTIFQVTTSGSEHTIYGFQGAGEGATPEGALVLPNGTFYGLVYFNGKLYGTTSAGGAHTGGTVFSISP